MNFLGKSPAILISIIEKTAGLINMTNISLFLSWNCQIHIPIAFINKKIAANKELFFLSDF